jgi:hypothetical protein
VKVHTEMAVTTWLFELLKGADAMGTLTPPQHISSALRLLLRYQL